MNKTEAYIINGVALTFGAVLTVWFTHSFLGSF